jgi:hypothetical protein
LPDFTCDFALQAKPFPHFWEHTVGSGHVPLALRADWQAQMLRCHDELGFSHVRFHALLSDEMGTLVCEEENYSILSSMPIRSSIFCSQSVCVLLRETRLSLATGEMSRLRRATINGRR